MEKEGSFPVQVIVSGMLSTENQKWLMLLSSNLQRQDAERIIIQTENLTQKDEKQYADSVLQVALSENKQLFHQMRGESADMCEALRELMKEDLEAARASGEEVGKEIGEKNGEQNMLIKALKNNRTAEEVAEFLNIPLSEVKAVEKQMTISSDG